MTSVVVAIGREPFESDLVAALNDDASGLHLVRRCVDAIDLASAALAGVAEAVVVGARLPRLDLATIDSVLAAGVRVVGVAADDGTATRLRAIGVDHVVIVDVAHIESTVHHLATVIGQLRAPQPAVPHDPSVQLRQGSGALARVVVVVGPAGAPGRSTVAANLARLLAAKQARTLLIDADIEAPCQAALLGVLVDEPGLARALRSVVDVGREPTPMRHVMSEVMKDVDLLSGTTGVHAPDVLRVSAIERLMTTAVENYSTVVCDSSSWRASDRPLEPIGSTGSQPLQALLGLADDVVVVASADPIGIMRVLPVLEQANAAAPQARITLALNRVRRSALGNAESDVLTVLRRHTDVPPTVVIADDRPAFDAAVLNASLVCDLAPKSRAAAGLRQLAERVATSHGAAASESIIDVRDSTGQHDEAQRSESPRGVAAMRAAVRRTRIPGLRKVG